MVAQVEVEVEVGLTDVRGDIRSVITVFWNIVGKCSPSKRNAAVSNGRQPNRESI